MKEQVVHLNNQTNYRAIADKIEEKSIRYPHTEEDKQALQARLSNSSVELSMLNQELADFKEELKPKMDAAKKGIANSIKSIRRGYEEVSQECYGIADHEKGFMEYYTADGIMVESRRLFPDEKQTFLRPM